MVALTRSESIRLLQYGVGNRAITNKQHKTLEGLIGLDGDGELRLTISLGSHKFFPAAVGAWAASQ